MSNKRRSFLIIFLAALMVLTSVITVGATGEDAVRIINVDRTLYGTYSTINAAHTAATDAKLNNYTIQLLKDVELEETLKLNNSLASTYTIDGNGKTISSGVAGKIAIQIYGSDGTVVNIKNLNVSSKGVGIEINNGKVNFYSGTYTNSSTTWSDPCVNANATDANNVSVNIYGGTYKTVYEQNEIGKMFAAVRAYSASEFSSCTMNVYGGYFYGNKSGNAFINGGGAIVKVYGGTFYNENSLECAPYTYHNTENGTTYIYGGNFVAGTKYNADTNEIEGNRVNNNNKAAGKLYITGGNYIGGSGILRNKGTTEGVTGVTEYSCGDASACTHTSPYVHSQSWDAASAPVMNTGAALLLASDKAGISFTTTVSSGTVTKLKALADAGTELSYGTVITGADVSALPYISTDVLKSAGVAYVDVTATDSVTEKSDGSVTFRGALVNIGSAYYSTEFKAISYVTVTIDGQAVRFYGLYDADASSSLADLASAALADVKNVQDTDYAHAVSGTANYSRYTADQRTAMGRFIAQ